MNENLALLPAIKQEPDIQEEPGIKKEFYTKEEPGIKKEFYIKEEPVIKKELYIGEEPGVMKEPFKCDNMIPFRKEGREILMEFSRNRKKVIYLDGSNTLFGEYKKLLVSDSSLSELQFCAYPVFQEFNPKFKTWVDIDHEENLRDGAVVKIRFYFKRIESDSSYPGSIKRKRDDFDTEPNPKQRRVDQGNFENYSDSWNKCLERNEVENVDPEKRSSISSHGIRKCQTVRRPRCYYSRNAISVRKNLFLRFRSNSLDRWGSEKMTDQVVPPSGESEKKQWFLMPEESHTDTKISSTNVQPQNFSEMEAALIHPESLLPSYVVEETTGAMLSGGQMNITPSRVQPLRVQENQCANSPQSRCTANITPSRLQPLLLQENQRPSSPQSSCSGRVGNLIGMKFMAPGTSTPAKTHTVFEAKPPANSTQKPAPNPKVYERSISWTYHIPKEMRLKRLSWGQQNLETIWWNTVFSDVAFFGLEGNYIKYYEKFDFSKIGSEIFWGLRSFDGPNIMAPLGFSLLGSKFAQVLRNKVIRSIKDHYRTGNVTLQFPGSLKTQFDSKIVRDVLKINSIAVSEWPSSARDLSPIRHAWKLVSEKVKNIQCFSNQQMISILLGVWEKDSDVQLMCSKVITLLPQIIKSVVEQNGSYPRVNARYIMTT